MPRRLTLPTTLRSWRAVYPHGGELRRYRGHWAVRTPDNPTFYWGNFLQFDSAPRPGDECRWPALFRHEVGMLQPATRHQALCWETATQGEVTPFLDRGWSYLESVVMVAHTVRRAPAPAVPAALRRLASDRDWATLADFNVRTRDEDFNAAGYRVYTDRRVAHWRRQSEAGAGVWVGAFVGAELAATLGLYAEERPAADGSRLARYQEVSTDPRWQRQGLCSALLAYAAELLQPLGIDRHVIVTDQHGAARRAYAARGFEVEDHWRGLLLPQPLAEPRRQLAGIAAPP
jgi:GNAT superfamily N-acetyltransferase